MPGSAVSRLHRRVPADTQSLRSERDVRAAYDEHGSELFGFAFRALRDRQLAEDVVQETFVRAWRSRGFDPERGSLRTWLFAIARNGVVDALRRRTVREGPGIASWEIDVGEPVRGVDDIDRLLDRVQLGEALDRLSPQHREAVVEVYFGGRSCAELGEQLGVPASTMRSRLYYGVRSLRLVLEENGWLAP